MCMETEVFNSKVTGPKRAKSQHRDATISERFYYGKL